MAQLTLATASGEAHGLVNSFPNRIKDTDFEKYDDKLRTELKKKKAHDSKMVKAEYVNSKGPHERLEMHYCGYAGDPIQSWRFIPGFIYEIPMGLIEIVNSSIKRMKKRSGLVVGDKAPLENDQEGEWIHKFVPVGWSS